MKKTSFTILFIIEIIAGLIAVGLLLSDLGALSYLIGIAIFAVVLLPFFVCLKKANNESKKEKIRRNIFLVMLIPSAIAIIAIAYVVVSLAIYFS
jgi:heme/copper-type cytochrome/quinol oxidase subunit 2